jgi:exonuclease SbcD
LDKPVFLGPDELEGLPLQILALPWISRSGLMANLELSAVEPSILYEAIEERLKSLVDAWLESADPALPIILTAHASVQGAKYGGERMVMLGGDLVLSGSLVKDPRLDYVALGHIHKPQNLNENAHPPVVYPGSIERVDFGEAADDKFFIIAHVERGQTRVEWRQLTGIRPFLDRFLTLETEDDRANLRERLFAVLPAQDELEGAIFRLTLEYPREWEELIDEGALRQYTAGTFEFHLVKRPQMQARIRLPGGQQLESLPPLEILELYWRSRHISEEEREALNKLAAKVIGEAEQDIGLSG